MAKRRKPTNKNVPAKGRLRDMADQLWSRAVRSDWNNCCAICGSSACEAHHLIPRQHEEMRYDLRNGIALCVQHHKFDPAYSPHQNAAGWMEWLTDTHPVIADWIIDNCRPEFTGTKNAQHYIDHIQRLRQYVEPEEFTRIVGVRFAAYLETT